MEPICIVTIIAMRGANSRQQMDEKSARVMAYPNGKTLYGYAIKTSGEGVEHVRVSDVGKTPEWIRCWERDGSNPLVSIDYTETQSDIWAKVASLIATAIHQIAISGLEIAKAIRERK